MIGELYRVSRLLRSPIAGEISPSRFRPDRLLQIIEKQPKCKRRVNSWIARNENRVRAKLNTYMVNTQIRKNTYRAMTLKVTLSHSTPFQTQESEEGESVQSYSTLSTSLNDFFISNRVAPSFTHIYMNKLFSLRTRTYTHKQIFWNIII